MESILAMLLGLFGVPLINLVKKALGWTGDAAVLLTVAFCFVFGVIAMALAGQLGADAFTAENLAQTCTFAFTAATLAYKLIAADK